MNKIYLQYLQQCKDYMGVATVGAILIFLYIIWCIGRWIYIKKRSPDDRYRMPPAEVFFLPLIIMVGGSFVAVSFYDGYKATHYPEKCIYDKYRVVVEMKDLEKHKEK